MWNFNNTNELYHHGTKGMKWGVRRYQNKDGSLTSAGSKRYSRMDIDKTRKVVNSSKDLADNLKNLNSSTMTSKRRKKMDLSKMSDKEMRDKINRELLERQYNDVFNPKKVSKGREYLNKTLSVAGGALAVTSSALGIALAVKELKG